MVEKAGVVIEEKWQLADNAQEHHHLSLSGNGCKDGSSFDVWGKHIMRDYGIINQLIMQTMLISPASKK